MRVVVADDSGLVRLGLNRLLADEGIEVVGEAENGDELLRRVAVDRPDVAIVDIRMPPTHTDEGLVAAARIREEHPAVAVLILSQYVEADYVLRLLESSEAHVGYLLKDRILEASTLPDALARVVAGETVVDRGLIAELVERPRAAGPLEALTPRELEVLAAVAEGLTNRGIAERLVVSEGTVHTHLRHIFAKLELPSGEMEHRRVHAAITYLRA